MKIKQNLLSKMILTIGTGLIITGAIFTQKYLERKGQQRNCERYGHLKGQPETSQRNYIVADLAKDNWGFKYEHPLGFADHVKRTAINGIIEDINHCQ